MNVLFNLLMVVFIIDVILLIPVIMMQSGSGAEAGMFGSGLTMGTFGAKTSEVLVNTTKWLVAIFMLSAFFLGYIQIMRTKSLTPTTPEAVQTEGTSEEAVATTTTISVEDMELETDGVVPETEDTSGLGLFTTTTVSGEGTLPLMEF